MLDGATMIKLLIQEFKPARREGRAAKDAMCEAATMNLQMFIMSKGPAITSHDP